MIASATEVRPGYVRGGLSTGTLRRVLCGERSLEDELTDGGTKPPQYVHYGRLAPGTLIGFVPYPEHPREIIVAKLPFARQIVPAVSLCVAGDDWWSNPQLISINQLKQYVGVILAADWLAFLVNQAASISNPKVHEHGVDRSLSAIGDAWERWEQTRMTWPQRCKDLARLTGSMELKPNTLLRRCGRLGLFHSDNYGHAASRDKRKLVA